MRDMVARIMCRALRGMDMDMDRRPGIISCRLHRRRGIMGSSSRHRMEGIMDMGKHRLRRMGITRLGRGSMGGIRVRRITRGGLEGGGGILGIKGDMVVRIGLVDVQEAGSFQEEGLAR